MTSTCRHTAALARAAAFADVRRSELAAAPVTGTATPDEAIAALETALGLEDVRAVASRFHAADAAWQAGLVATFGRRAADARYTAAARGEAGSELSRLYTARHAAYVAWCQANGLPAYQG